MFFYENLRIKDQICKFLKRIIKIRINDKILYKPNKVIRINLNLTS
jgi:hypothetical protein